MTEEDQDWINTIYNHFKQQPNDDAKICALSRVLFDESCVTTKSLNWLKQEIDERSLTKEGSENEFISDWYDYVVWGMKHIKKMMIDDIKTQKEMNSLMLFFLTNGKAFRGIQIFDLTFKKIELSGHPLTNYLDVDQQLYFPIRSKGCMNDRILPRRIDTLWLYGINYAKAWYKKKYPDQYKKTELNKAQTIPNQECVFRIAGGKSFCNVSSGTPLGRFSHYITSNIFADCGVTLTLIRKYYDSFLLAQYVAMRDTLNVGSARWKRLNELIAVHNTINDHLPLTSLLWYQIFKPNRIIIELKSDADYYEYKYIKTNKNNQKYYDVPTCKAWSPSYVNKFGLFYNICMDWNDNKNHRIKCIEPKCGGIMTRYESGDAVTNSVWIVDLLCVVCKQGIYKDNNGDAVTKHLKDVLIFYCNNHDGHPHIICDECGQKEDDYDLDEPLLPEVKCSDCINNPKEYTPGGLMAHKRRCHCELILSQYNKYCNECTCTFREMRMLLRHKELHHTAPTEGKYVCCISYKRAYGKRNCTARFHSYLQMRQHQTEWNCAKYKARLNDISKVPLVVNYPQKFLIRGYILDHSENDWFDQKILIFEHCDIARNMINIIRIISGYIPYDINNVNEQFVKFQLMDTNTTDEFAERDIEEKEDGSSSNGEIAWPFDDNYFTDYNKNDDYIFQSM